MERQFKNLQTEIKRIVEISPHTLYFAVLRGTPPECADSSAIGIWSNFIVDEELIYQNYYFDFGSLNILCLYKYCLKVNKYLQQYARGIVYYTTSHPDRNAYTAYLMGCFCVLYLKILPKEIIKFLKRLDRLSKAFFDASQFICPFVLKMLNCFQTIVKGNTFNFSNFVGFNSSEYDLYNKLKYDDINWLLPRKFLAFIGPADDNNARSLEFYIKYFPKNDVKTVIGLNNTIYDSYAFMRVRIQHYDLFFPDGSAPSKAIFLKFLYIAECALAAMGVFFHFKKLVICFYVYSFLQSLVHYQ
ncbi:dual specificity protein phosphatase CDC14A-like [Euwallacea similis]|uniref:dual specificity protein phosphatase CDC14A-like n=1 Tax=Euwallacea similis TaxID=1736056 RepID=UPI00344BE670